MKINLRLSRTSTLALLLATLALLLAAGCSLLPEAQAQEEPPTPLPPVADDNSNLLSEGKLVPREDGWLWFEAAGEVVDIPVTEGQQVSAGTVLARLGDRESAEAALADAEMEQVNAQQALDDLQDTAGLAAGQVRQEVAAAEQARIEAQEALDDLDTEEYQDDIDDAKIDVEDTKDDLDDAQEEFDKYADLDENNATRQRAKDDLDDAQQKYNDALREYDTLINDLEQARADVEHAVANLDDARRRYDERKDGPAPDELAKAEARLRRADAQVTAAQAALDRLELTAPYDGTVVEIDLAPGEQTDPGQRLILLADLSEWYVETSDLTELEVVDISEGQEVAVTPDALPNLSLTGEVVQIAQNYTEKAGDVLYTVRIRLNEDEPRLRWGMTVEVDFQPGG